MTIAEIDPDGKFIHKYIVRFPEPYPAGQGIISIGSGSITVLKNLAFYPRFYVAAGSNSQLFAGLSDSLIIQKYNRHGMKINRLQAFSHLYPFTRSDLDSLAQKKGRYFKGNIKKVGLPQHWPVFQQLLIDDEGRCWVELFHPGASKQPWLIFDKAGNPKWKVTLPTAVTLIVVKNGEAYGIRRPQKGFSSVVRYHISGM